MTADPSTLAPDDRLLAAYFDERMEATADRVLDDLVAKVLADDAAKDALIADLLAAYRYVRAVLLGEDDNTFASHEATRGMAYVASLP